MITEKEIQTWYKIVDCMDVPEERKAACESNFRWFLRSGWATNHNHSKINEALAIARAGIS